MIVPALIKILVVFGCVLLLNRCRVWLGVALALGGAVLDLWAGRYGMEFLRDSWTAVTRPETWLLVLIIALILELGRFLAEDHNAQVIMAAARRLGGRHGRAASVMALPAVIGLVPMPGGALFSAPLVQQTLAEDGWSPGWKAAVNYWFRHVWEYWWPLYPVVILSLSIFTMPTWQYMVVMMPFSVVAIVAGFFFLVRPHLAELKDGGVSGGERWQRALFLALPVVIIVLATMLLPAPVHHVLPDLSRSACKMVAMIVGLVVGLALIFWDERGQVAHKPFVHLKSSKSINMLVTLGGVMVFQSFLDSSGLMPQAAAELISSGIPLVSVVAILPFVAGLVTGIAVGYAGPAFPLLVGLVEAEGSGLTPVATLVLGFGFGYAGMMLSPVHLCFVLTKQYFDSTYGTIYRQILGCIAVLVTASIVGYTILTAVGW